MKLNKDEILNKINSLELSDELKIELMGDISDSISEPDTSEVDSKISELETALQSMTDKYNELIASYKERFLSGEEVKIEETEEEELKEEEVIDVKEIF